MTWVPGRGRIVARVGVASLGFSKKQIKKAGTLLREFLPAYRAKRGQPDADSLWDRYDPDDVLAALEVVDQFRAAHARPLAKVNANLRYYVRKVGMSEPDVTQRLKRKSTIMEKLEREPTMQLNTMEDIAGVRSVLMNQRQVDAVRRCLEKAPRWNIRRVRDYVANPKPDGYRAIHVIVEKDGCYVEIQLRTPWQDSWAQSVEQDTRRLRQGLKFGRGPDDLRDYYRMVSELFAMRERDEAPPQEFMEELAKRYEAVRRYFPKGNGH